MNIYVVRHGQTDYNVEGKFQGQVDIKMNKNGEKQVEKTAEELNNIEFDIVFSSPLSRAVETAQKITNKEIQLDKRIIERSFGDLEGKKGIPDFEENIEKYNIESIECLIQRVKSFFDEVIERYKEKENILIVTHEGIAQIINLYFGQKNKDNFKEFRLPTGEYKKYEI